MKYIEIKDDKCPELWKKHDMLKNLKPNESKPIVIKFSNKAKK